MLYNILLSIYNFSSTYVYNILIFIHNIWERQKEKKNIGKKATRITWNFITAENSFITCALSCSILNYIYILYKRLPCVCYMQSSKHENNLWYEVKKTQAELEIRYNYYQAKFRIDSDLKEGFSVLLTFCSLFHSEVFRYDILSIRSRPNLPTPSQVGMKILNFCIEFQVNVHLIVLIDAWLSDVL